MSNIAIGWHGLLALVQMRSGQYQGVLGSAWTTAPNNAGMIATSVCDGHFPMRAIVWVTDFSVVVVVLRG
jgi:hypothetical protein